VVRVERGQKAALHVAAARDGVRDDVRGDDGGVRHGEAHDDRDGGRDDDRVVRDCPRQQERVVVAGDF